MPQLSSSENNNCMAYAIFDNKPDTQDELAFRKSDLLVVLEQNIPNYKGWWLCSLNGREGLCPANRLKLLPNTYDKPSKNREFHNFPSNQKVPLRRDNELGFYDMPNRYSPSSHQNSNVQDEISDYDVPPSRHIALGVQLNCSRCSTASPSCTSPVGRDVDAYDVPRPHNHSLGSQLTPSSSASSLLADSMSSSNRSSMANMPDYDVPKPFQRGYGPQLGQLYDVPPSHFQKELPLELDSALENLERLENDAMSSIKKLLGFVGPRWRCREKLNETILDIKLVVTRLQTSLNDLAEFGEGTLGNATKAADKNLAVKLNPLVSNLRKSYQTVNDSSHKLIQSNWNIDALCVAEDSEDKYIPDALDSLISCSKALTEDIREITSFIRGNSLLLFKKDKEKEWTNVYDFINEDSKETTDSDKNYDFYIEERNSTSSINFDLNDRNLLTFFGTQFVTHYKNLMGSIEAFLNTVERNQPPKIFLAHGKFVVLSAHKLVHIGDTVYRNMACKEVKERTLNCSNALSDVLAQSVNKIKQAALQFPTVAAVQEMVDSVLEISNAANNLRMCLLQAAANFL